MIRRWAGSVRFGVAAAVALAACVAAVVVLWALVDPDELRAGLDRGLGDPLGLVVIALALLAAFSMRAVAWCRVLGGLPFGQSLAAVHVALGANHVLPFRLGEPMRIASAVRRTDVGLGPATSTTVLLRAADVVALVVLGLVAAPALVTDGLGAWGVAVVALVAVVGLVAAVVVARQRAGAARSGAIAARLPDPGTLVLVVAAWLAEAVAVWRVSEWFDLGLGAREAVAVLAAAVSIQLVAIAPGGVGTYEAAASTALVATGAPLSTAVTAAVVLHGVKTIYSLVAGSIGLVAPQPSMIGHLRLPRTVPEVPPAPAGDGPVVLFLPARNEAPRAAPVIAAAPAEIDGHPVEVVVIDDGSTDDTAAVARAAGADVVTHETNRGLGAAVRTGFAEAVRRGAVAAAFCDADGEYDPAELATLVRPILDGDAHYVVGSRFRGEIARMLPHRRLGNLTLTRWVRFVTRAPITDGQSGYRALSGAAAASVRIAHDYNYAQVLTVDLVAGGFGYREVPITYAFRSTGRSFVRLGTYLRHVVPTVWRQLNPAVPPGPDRPRRDHEPAHR